MSPIKKVTLAGASGNVGPAILKELVDAGFEVTVLTRSTSSNKFPANVTAKPVDYESLESLTEALKGQDAVVSTIGTAALSAQLLLVDAAAKAGVQRFIPSEFGSDSSNDKNVKNPVFSDKIKIQEALKTHAADGSMSYTALITGPFFDWGLMVGFIGSPAKKQMTIFDGGDRKFSTTTLPTIGKAVVGVLNNPKETANRPVYIQDTALTQNELLAICQQATGGPEGWNVTQSRISDELDAANAELKKENPDPSIFAIKFILASIWGEGHGGHFQKLDNELLGIPQMSDGQVRAVVERYAK